ELDPHLARALKLFPRDPSLLVDLGTLHEAYGSPRLQNIAMLPATGQFRTTPRAIRSQSDEWNEAERLFREALASDSSYAEARVRLARVLELRGLHAAAVTEASRALAGPLPPVIEYYGALALGRAQEALSQHDLARASFERATRLYPAAQSPRLALS